MLLVTGASGFVGRHFLRWNSSLSPADALSVLPLFRTGSLEGGRQVDLRSSSDVTALFDSVRVTGVLHLAAESRTGVCQKNPQLADAGNVETTRNLLAAARRHNAWFGYVSTDMVFSGKHAPYDNNDVPDPLNVYGKSKLAAEAMVREYSGPGCIVRPALIYGEMIDGRGSSLSWTLDVLRSGVGGFFSDEWRTPVFVDDLVRLLHSLAIQGAEGTFHAGGLERLSRWDFAGLAASTWDLPVADGLRSELGDDPENAWRPRDLSLLSLESQDIVPFTPVREALKLIRSRDSG